MLEAFLSFLIILIVVVAVAVLALWAVQRFLPEVYTPARIVVGVVVILILLFAILGIVRGSPLWSL